MHVADIWTCDVNGTPQSVFTKPCTVYWKVKIVDTGGAPVSGANVVTDLYKPGQSTVWTSKNANTDANGIASMNINIVNNGTVGTYTIKVKSVTKSGWTYDSAANVKSETTFVVQ